MTAICMPRRPQIIHVVHTIHGGAKWVRVTQTIAMTSRLNNTIGYITAKDMLAGHHQKIQADRRSEIGGGQGTAEESPPAGRPTNEVDYFRIADQDYPGVGLSIITSAFIGANPQLTLTSE